MMNALLVVIAGAMVAVAGDHVHHRSVRTLVTPIVGSRASPASMPNAVPSNRAAPAAARRSAAITPDTTKVNSYVSYNAGAKTVAITLIAAATSTNGGLNFNGGSKGDQTITVPAGWTVHVDFQNHDIIPHSAIVIRNQASIPMTPSKPAFPRAFTVHLSDGLPAQTGHDTMQFKTSAAGQYLIACGVPGHAMSGMYIRFVVSSTATVPTNTGAIATP